MTMAPLKMPAEGQGARQRGPGGEFGVRGFVEAFDADTGESALEDLHCIPCAGRARRRHLAEGGHLEDWRRFHLDDRKLRSGRQHQSWGNRQRLALVRRSAAGNGQRTSLDGRAGRRLPARSRAISIPQNESREEVGLGRDEHFADAVGFPDGHLAPRQTCPSRHSAAAISTGWGVTTTAAFPAWTRKAASRRTCSRALVRNDRAAGHQPRAQAGDWQGRTVHPGRWGGKDWPFEPTIRGTGMVYIPSSEGHCNNLEGKVKRRSAFPASGGPASRSPTSTIRSTRRPVSATNCNSYDVNDGKRVWRDPVFELDELGFGADDRRRSGVRRRHQRPSVPAPATPRPVRSSSALPHQLNVGDAFDLRGSAALLIYRSGVRLTCIDPDFNSY